jgi:hypothetical protein
VRYCNCFLLWTLLALKIFVHLRKRYLTFLKWRQILRLWFFFSAEAALNCYTSVSDGSIKEECGMQTGCIKKFYQKSKLWQEKASMSISRHTGSTMKKWYFGIWLIIFKVQWTRMDLNKKSGHKDGVKQIQCPREVLWFYFSKCKQY